MGLRLPTLTFPRGKIEVFSLFCLSTFLMTARQSQIFFHVLSLTLSRDTREVKPNIVFGFRMLKPVSLVRS